MEKRIVKQIAFVENNSRREVTFSKRKKRLLMKSIELSKMCDVEICLTIFDRSKQKMIQYCSDYKFNPILISKLTQP